MSKYSLTIIAVSRYETGFLNTIESLIKATSKLQGTQLIIADCSDTEESNNAIRKAKSARAENVISLTLPQKEESEAFNEALPLAEGKRILFLEDGVIYNKKAFRALIRAAKKHPDVSITLAAEAKNKEDTLRKYARFPMERDGVIDLCTLPWYGHTALSTYLFRAEDIKGLTFDKELHLESKKKFILEALLKNPKVFVVESLSCFYSHALENDPNLFENQYFKWYYTPSINNFMIPFMEKLKEENGEVPRFVQYALSQLICAKYGNNYYENDKGVLTTEEAYEFHEAVLDALQYIDNHVFTEAAIRCKYILRSLWMQLLKGKLKKADLPYTFTLQSKEEVEKTADLTENDRQISLCAEGNENARIATLKSVAVTINVINYHKGVFEFDAEFTGKDFFETDEIELFAEYGGKKHRLEEYPIYPLLKCFGVPYAKKYNVHFFVPEKELDTLTFGYNFAGEYHVLPIQFAGQFSRLRLRFGPAYWKYNNESALEIKNNNTLRKFSCKGFKQFTREIALYISMLLRTPGKFFACQCVALRMIYRLTKPFYNKKRIFLTFDKLYKAGDNGEYFWKYANTVKDDVETYYIVSDTSLDYPRLKKYDKKHTVVHNSLKCRLLALNMDAIVATHTLVMQYCGFPKYLHPYFLDLWHAPTICIQHGLTVQQLAQYQRRNYDNTTLYCLASKYEKKNLMHPIYGYEEDMLKLNGLARYDGLKSDDRRVILITPTWRRNVVSQGIAYKKKPYNEHFKHTEYFRLYNTLINDERLIECAKKNGYSITYLLHPAMSPQLEDFKDNGFVKIIAASGDMNYEEVLTQSSLMVTDYSGVQFDFAYMRKPIVYYHPDTLPPHYEAGGIDYPTQGFGPICTDHKSVVDAICRFMDNNCKAQEEYKKRADDFFEFDDFNNAERIYKEILDFLEK